MAVKAIEKNDKSMDFSEYSQVFLMNDQPTTCPKCGSRTDYIYISDLPVSELHICLSNSCKFVFIVEEDTEIQYIV